MLASHPEINVLYFAAGGVAGGCRAAVESGRIDAMRIFTYDCVPSTKNCSMMALSLLPSASSHTSRDTFR